MFCKVLLAYAFYYPLTMSILWMSGGMLYYWRHERKRAPYFEPPSMEVWPKATIVIPMHNEEAQVRETIRFALDQDYPDFEVIAVNDGSRDATGEILDTLTTLHPRLRVIHLLQNQGKAMGLRAAALAAESEFLICIDGDALLDRHAARWMMSHFVNGPRVGAVTGNPRIRNRSTLLGRIQVGEFSSIIGLIKRAQRIYGRVFTVSGVIVAFRVAAIHAIGYWNTDMITEDIDISWRLQMACWDVRYEPNALCWILMPETLKGLWKQRLRWAQGGAEVTSRYLKSLAAWRKRRMWGVLTEYILSVIWSYDIFAIMFLGIVSVLFPVHLPCDIPGPLPGWYGVILGLTCLLQFAVSLLIDRRYEKAIGRQSVWIIWYPILYWLVGMLTAIIAVPKVLTTRKRGRAVWSASDRGIA